VLFSGKEERKGAGAKPFPHIESWRKGPIFVRMGQTPEASAPVNRTVVSGREDFSAALDDFQGPLDLLLYLIKENEVEITQIPIARILDQYLKFIENVPALDLHTAGEFLVMAATLMEIKSRELLPVQEQQADGEEIIEDPRSELVRQLLQYRRLKDQAKLLEELQDRWDEYRPRRLFDDLPDIGESDDPEAARMTVREALVDVDIFALFSAYERVLKSILSQQPRNIVMDTETLEQKVERIEAILKVRPFAKFHELIGESVTRADIAATFFALLELVRRRAVKLVQESPFGNMDVRAREDSDEDVMAQEAEDAEALERATLQAKAEQDALAAQAAVDGLPWTRRRGQARPKFEGIVRPEDVEEIDAEEAEISRRIDAILAAADAISDRFERSRDGRVREDEQIPAEVFPPEAPASGSHEASTTDAASTADAPPESPEPPCENPGNT
jgi:segregation and condensation protein A